MEMVQWMRIIQPIYRNELGKKNRMVFFSVGGFNVDMVLLAQSSMSLGLLG